MDKEFLKAVVRTFKRLGVINPERIADVRNLLNTPTQDDEEKELLNTIDKYLNRKLPIFVYGTLKEGGYWWNNKLRGYSTHKQAELEKAELRNYGSYPILFLNGNNTVQGELVTVAEENYPSMLASLDRLELSSGYTREIVTVKTIEGEVEVFTYVSTLTEEAKLYYPVIENGNFKINKVGGKK